MRVLIIICFLLGFSQINGWSQPQTPFNKGVNLTGWFQAGGPRQIQFSRYTKKDFEQIQSLGCDVIRLPINLHFMTNGSPNYILDPLFLNFLDQAVDWAEELNLHLIFDNHTFDPAANTDPNIGEVLEKVWVQMAEHYKDRSNLIYYEVLNEPHGISDAAWNAIQKSVVEKIRTVDTKHTIIIGGAGWNSFWNLAAMPTYDDDNLIYTFHFYDPFLFTHQGASWVDPSMETARDVPFPYDAFDMPGRPAVYNGTWVGNLYNSYSNDGNAAKIKELIDIAVDFRDRRNVPVFCGEFGVYIPNSKKDDRVAWYQVVQEYLTEKKLGWTIWDYHGGFGLFEGSNTLFDHNLNTELLEALDFNVPPQTPYVLTPDSSGFFIYTDVVETGIFSGANGTGEKDFYNDNNPNVGNYSLSWTGESQYGSINFDFRPNKDMSYLVANGYALNFLVKSDAPTFQFDIRFMDTKTGTDDRPWRMRTIIDNNTFTRDGEWQRVHIPLSSFFEHGSWDNNTWHEPEGKFDWTAIDRFEIVSEYSEMGSDQIFFDHIQVTDQMTSSSKDLAKAPILLLSPNPVFDQLNLQVNESSTMHYQLMGLTGIIIEENDFQSKAELDMKHLPKGIYLLKVDYDGKSLPVQKIVKQ